ILRQVDNSKQELKVAHFRPCGVRVKGGGGQQFPQAAETVARSTDAHAAVPILVSGDTVKRKNSIAAFGNQALTVPPFYRMPRSICRSISKISSDLGARFCGGSSSAKRPLTRIF